MDKDVVLITGSSGLIGAAAVLRFAPEYRIIGFDREGAPHPPAKAECVCVDLTSDESLRAGMERVRWLIARIVELSDAHRESDVHRFSSLAITTTNNTISRIPPIPQISIQPPIAGIIRSPSFGRRGPYSWLSDQVCALPW